MKELNKSERKDGCWNLTVIKGISYEKDNDGIGIYALLEYEDNETKATEEEKVPLAALMDKVVGNQYERIGGVDTLINDNVTLKRKTYVFQVNRRDLGTGTNSKPLYKLWKLARNEYEEKAGSARQFFAKHHISPSVGYIGCHLIANTNPTNNVDWFIVPSSEIFRFFFLHSSRLASELLGNLSRARNTLDFIKEICQRKSDIFVKGSGKKIAFIKVKEGYKKKDRDVLARITYIDGAKKCIKALQTSIYEKGFGARELSTYIPQDMPFWMAVSGSAVFTRQGGVRYVLVNQIYDTKEQFPYDQIIFEPLDKDSRSYFGAAGGKRDYSGSVGVRTKPAKTGTLSHENNGDADNIGELGLSINIGYKFSDNKAVEQIKLPKEEQEIRHLGFSTVDMEKLGLTTGLGINPDSSEGRVRVYRKDDEFIENKNPRRDNFFAALSLQTDYRVSYLEVLQESCSFVGNRVFTEAAEGRYNVICCLLEKEHSKLYIVRCDSTNDDSSRYAIFHAENFGLIPIQFIKILHDDLWFRKGLYVSPVEKGLSKFISCYERHNQGWRDVVELKSKIIKELDLLLGFKAE